MSVFAIEGTNGSGKSSTCKLLVEKLKSEGYPCEFARLPGYEQIDACTKIRLLLDDKSLPPITKFHLYLADMSLLYSKVDKEKVWILDRSYISTMVYQMKDGIPIQTIKDAIRQAGIYLDGCILLTCSSSVLKQRLDERQEKTLGSFSNQDISFYRELQNSYSLLFSHDKNIPHKHTIDTTSKTMEQTAEDAYNFIKTIL